MPLPSSPVVLAFAAGAAAASAVCLASRYLYPGSISGAKGGPGSSAAPAGAGPSDEIRAPDPLADEAFVREQLSRHSAFFGDDAEAAIERAFVVVVGVGGVGSHAAHMLARAGIRRLRIIDFDNVSLSSLNRHACAGREDVGTPKVAALSRAIRRFMPKCVVEPVQRIFEGRHAEELLLGVNGSHPDFVIDAIDDVETKGALVAFCSARNIRVVCSLGAGGKADPTRICLGDLNDVRKDPLAVALRLQLRKTAPGYQAHDLAFALGGPVSHPGPGPKADGEGNACIKDAGATGIACVYSSELPRAKLLPLEMDAAAGDRPQDFGALAGFRVRVLPVLGTMPALFGQAIAAHVLCVLAGPQHEIEQPRKVEGATTGSVSKIQRHFATWCSQRYAAMMYELNRALARIQLSAVAEAGAASEPLPSLVLCPSLEEVEYVINEVWHSRSALGRERLGTRGVALQLARWRPHLPSLPSNVVLVSDDEANAMQSSTVAAVIDALAELEKLPPSPSFDTRALRRLLTAATDAALVRLLGQATVERVSARLAWVEAQGW